MKIKTIELSWFRGAADPILLDTKGKSVVIYGDNGAGKSSFVDAIEYALRNGRITHLSHEFSGKHQERAIHNVSKPEGTETEFTVIFDNGSMISAEIEKNGKYKALGNAWAEVYNWNYRRTVLRQNEVSEFVHDTKGGKYSTLLPLFGLDELVNRADNIHELIKSIEAKTNLKVKISELERASVQREKIFGSATDQEIAQRIRDLHILYCSNDMDGKEIAQLIIEIEHVIKSKIEHNNFELERHGLLKKIGNVDLRQNISLVRQANSKIAENIDPLILEKLDVLRSTIAFANKTGTYQEVDCPACGRAIKTEVLYSHIQTEQKKLKEVISTNNSRKSALSSLHDSIKDLTSNIKKEHLDDWRNAISKKHKMSIEYLNELDVEKIRSSCDEPVLVKIEELLLPVVDAAIMESRKSSPDTKKLVDDKDMVEEAKSIARTGALKDDLARTEEILSFLGSLEQQIRANLAEQIKALISEISSDMQKMWGILHPGEKITDISLYNPDDEEKALDICMKFYGNDQPSPRNTLSEGYRNSLGLSIFLSMAKRGAENTHPLFLDDVIVSLDRNHRGMVVELLEQEFSDRQVFIFTHDRVWYTELRHQLDDKKWEFRTLLPYETPDIGIRWSHKTSTFEIARASLENRPDTAGNDVRKIMDTELAVIAEKLKIEFPFVRGEKNDMRIAHDFLERMVSVGAKKFQKRKENTDEYEAYSEAIEAFMDADKLIISWANRSSHSFDLMKPEAEKLIGVCEKALEFFKCSSCKKKVWLLTANDFVRCDCGALRWKL